MSELDPHFQHLYDEAKAKRDGLGEVTYKNHLEQIQRDAEEAAFDLRSLASRGGKEIGEDTLARIAAITAVAEAIAAEVQTLG